MSIQMVNPVGFEFRPTDEEIVDYYLRLKNLDTNTSLVDQVISTVNICSFDPWELPSQSRINRSIDQVWYFFGSKENKYNIGDRQSRKTKTGFWKKTGVTLDITRKRGKREKIGQKKVLVFHLSKIPNGSRSSWVMHEYHATFLPPNQMITYTVCKVEFKGEERDISSSSGSEVGISQSLIPPMNNSGGFGGSSFEWLTSQELQDSRQFTGPLDMDEMDMTFNNLLSDDWKSLWDDDDEQRNVVSMQEDRNDYRPKKSLTGVFIGHSSDDSDSDLISSTTSSIQTSSTCDSFASSNPRIEKIIEQQESPNSTINLVSLAPKVSQTKVKRLRLESINWVKTLSRRKEMVSFTG